MSLSSLSRIDACNVHHADDVRPEFYDQCREAALMDAPSQFPRGSAQFQGEEWGAYDNGFCGSRECAGRGFCPPAGASQEVNEAAVSVAAPAASGQSAGIRPSKRVLWRYRTSRAIVARELAGEPVPWSVIRQCAANVIAGYA